MAYSAYPRNVLTVALLCAASLFAPTTRASAADVIDCEAYAGSITTDSTQQCLVNGSVTLVAVPGGDALIPPGYQLGYVLTSTNGLSIEQVGPDPAFTVSGVNIWRIHSLVYDPNTLDFAAILDLSHAYQLQDMLVQGGGGICASFNIGGAGTKTTECEQGCEADAGTISALNPDQCLVDGSAELEATPDGNAAVPAGYSVIHVLTTGPDLVILAVGVEPSFPVSFEGPFAIHTLVYDPATLDLSGIIFGETSAFEIAALLQEGGGPICGSLDTTGAQFQVADCNPVCEAYAGTLTAVADEVCLVDGMAHLEATPNGDAVVPDGYSVAYIFARPNGIIENVEPITLFEWPLLGTYIIHTLVYDPFTINPYEVILGVTNIAEINAVLIQGGGSVCGSLDLVGATFSVIECEPVCDADAGTLTAVESEVCRVDGVAHLDATPNGNAVVPNGYSVAYILARANGIIENVEPITLFEWPLLGDYAIHTIVYDPLTFNPYDVILSVTNIQEFNSALIQGGGTICGSLDMIGAAISVIECAPPCDDDAGIGGDRILCYTDPSVDLFSLLTGTPEEGGTWTGPDGEAFAGTFNPATDEQGVYVYFVTDGPDCPGDTTQLVISLIECPGPCTTDAGTDASTVACSNQPSFALLPLSGGDAGGTWFDPLSQPHPGVYNPAIDPAGNYTYVIEATDECPADSAIVTIALSSAPDAGISSQIVVCDSDAPVFCYGALGGAPDAGGVWTGPNGDPFNGTFDPATDPPGIYTYVVAGTSPCADAMATLAITVQDCCDAGEDADTTVCFTDAPFVMIDLLGGDPCPDGEWTAPDGSVIAGTFNPGMDASGGYTYAVTSGNGSVDVATLTISVIECPTTCEADAGSLSTEQPELCLENGSALLMAAPNGDAVVPAGYELLFVLTTGPELVIIDADAVPFFTVSGLELYTIHTLVYDPNTLDISVIEFGTTTASELAALLIQGGGNVCASLDLAGAQILVINCEDVCAGAAGEDASVEVCNDGSTTDLFPLLGGSPLPGGIWFWIGSGQINPEILSGIYDSMVGQGGMAGYVVSGGPDCPNDTAYVTVTEIECTDPCAGSDPDAGIGGDIIRCTVDPVTWLFDLLQGTPDVGGFFTGPDGQPFDGFFDPLTDAPGTYVYTVFDLQDCPPDTTQLNITVVECPDQLQLVAWPNPTVDIVTFQFAATLSNAANIIVVDATGRKCNPPVSIDGKQVTLHAGAMPAGTYTLRMIDGATTGTGRFVRAAQ